jgi:hypothetical protein
MLGMWMEKNQEQNSGGVPFQNIVIDLVIGHSDKFIEFHYSGHFT